MYKKILATCRHPSKSEVLVRIRFVFAVPLSDLGVYIYSKEDTAEAIRQNILLLKSHVDSFIDENEQACSECIKEAPTAAGFVTGTGSFKNGISLAFYKDETFSSLITESLLLGQILFAQAAWSTTSLQDKINFYVQKCDVVSVNAAQEEVGSVRIIDQSCYAQVVDVTPLGSAVQNKIVKHKSQFSYRSFTFHRNVVETQLLRCDVEFCLLSEGTT